MSVEKRTNSNGTRSWRIRWREGDRNRARTFATRRDAELFESDLVRRRRLGTLATLDSGTITLDRFITDAWAPQRAADFKPATRTFYAGLYRAHIAPTFATVPLRDISPQRVAAWQADRVKAGGGRKAIREALSLLGGILGYAVELEHLQVNAARAVRPVKRARRSVVQPLPPATVESVRAILVDPMPVAVPETARKSTRRRPYELADTRDPQTRQRDAVLVSVLAYAGLRPGEALALTWLDVRDCTLLVEHATDGTGGRKGTKTDHARTVRLLDALAVTCASGDWPLAVRSRARSCSRAATATSGRRSTGTTGATGRGGRRARAPAGTPSRGRTTCATASRPCCSRRAARSITSPSSSVTVLSRRFAPTGT